MKPIENQKARERYPKNRKVNAGNRKTLKQRYQSNNLVIQKQNGRREEAEEKEEIAPTERGKECQVAKEPKFTSVYSKAL